MNKRELVTKGMAVGTLSLIMAGAGGKSVMADTTDWRDELLKLHTGYSIHTSLDITYPEGRTGFNGVIENYSIGIYWWETNKWAIIHDHRIRDTEIAGYFESFIVNEKLEGHGTEFDTLKEAYHYAKELKQKHYT